MSGAALEIEDVSMAFSGLLALSHVSLSLPHGSIVGLIGPNGSGKTTLLNCISGVYRPTGGDIRLDRRSLTHAACHEIAALGIRRTFQQSLLVPSMTALENVLVGAHCEISGDPISAMLALWRLRRRDRRERAKAMSLLGWLGIGHLADVRADAITGPSRKLIELARALISNPSHVLLDEVASGLNSAEKDWLVGRVREFRARTGSLVLLVEHDLDFVMALADRVVVLNSGVVLADGRPGEVQRNAEVIGAYIGA